MKNVQNQIIFANTHIIKKKQITKKLEEKEDNLELL